VIKGKFITVVPMLESSILAFSAASRRRWRAILSRERSIFLVLGKEIIHCTIQLSKSSPPRWLFPAVALTSNTLPLQNGYIKCSASQVEHQNPLLLINLIQSVRAAAVGSLMMRSTSSPAIVPASLVACRCASVK